MRGAFLAKKTPLNFSFGIELSHVCGKAQVVRGFQARSCAEQLVSNANTPRFVALIQAYVLRVSQGGVAGRRALEQKLLADVRGQEASDTRSRSTLQPRLSVNAMSPLEPRCCVEPL